jgi:cysteine desulfuration protein SufE
MIQELKVYAENLKEVYALEQEMGQYQYLIDIGNKSPTFTSEEQSETNKMFGCQAQVWIVVKKEKNIFYFRGDSDAAIVKGLVEIITKAMSGHSQEEIKDIKHSIVDQLGLGPGLTVRRQVGMMAMIDHIKKVTGAK